MILNEVTSIPDETLPLGAFKDHLRMGTGFSEDDLQNSVLSSFLRAAIANIEARTSKILIQRAFQWKLHVWRDARGQVLPISPVVAISEMTLEDRLGASQVVDAASYRLEIDSQRPRLMPTGFVLPAIPLGGAATISLVAGYATNWTELPNDLAQAVLLLAAHYYEFRHETSLSQGCMPFGVTSLIEPYRNLRISGGRGQ